MSIPPEINSLVERLNDELNQIEREANQSVSLARGVLERFPDNFAVIQIVAFLNSSLFFVEISRRQIQARLDDILASEAISRNEIAEAGEELAIELGRALETKIRVNSLKVRLENLQ